MRVLVACEESQEVCKAFRALGHEAYSCDIQEPSGGHPEWHIHGDALIALKGGQVTTMDGATHDVEKWDLLIAHPPCTYLTAAASVILHKGGKLDTKRMDKAREAKRFFMKFLSADCPRIAVENPVPEKIHGLPEYSQIIQPFFFGDPWRKRTCLWLKGLPNLQTDHMVDPKGLWCGNTSFRRDPTLKYRYELKSHRDPKVRSKTFPGIARAMAEQWGGKCE